jgi:hypothetical protein
MMKVPPKGMELSMMNMEIAKSMDQVIEESLLVQVHYQEAMTEATKIMRQNPDLCITILHLVELLIQRGRL